MTNLALRSEGQIKLREAIRLVQKVDSEGSGARLEELLRLEQNEAVKRAVGRLMEEYSAMLIENGLWTRI